MICVRRTLKIHLDPAFIPWTGTFTRLPRASSSFVSGSSRDGESTISGLPVPVPRHFHSKKFLPNIWPKPLPFQFKVIPPCLCPYKKSLSGFPLGPLKVLESGTRSPQSLLFSRVDSSSSLSLSSWEECSIHLIIFVALL